MPTQKRRTPAPTGPALEAAIDDAFGPITAPIEPASAPPAVELNGYVPASLDEALAMFQANLPAVAKKSEGKVEKDGRLQYTYRYANLADIHAAALPLIGQYGLSWRCKPTQTPEGFGLVYVLRHVSGDEDGGFWPLGDPKQIKPQAMGSLITYAKRYTLCAMLGIAPEEDDDDGREAQREAAERQAYERDERNWTRQRATEKPAAATVPGQRQPSEPTTVDLTGLTLEQLSRHFFGVPKEQRAAVAPTYGAEFARRVAALKTRDDLKAMYAEIRAMTGDDKSKTLQLLPWSHNGSHMGDVLTLRREQISNEIADAQRVKLYEQFGEQIAGAKTPERLEEIGSDIVTATDKGDLSPAQREDLDAQLVERERAMLRAKPASTAPAPAPAEPNGSIGYDVDDPWLTASVPASEPGDAAAEYVAMTEPPAVDDEPATEPDEQPVERSAKYDLHWATIWGGLAHAEAQAALDGGLERDELSADEYNDLCVFLAERPAEPVTLLLWRAEKAPHLLALDKLRDEVTDMRAKDKIGQRDSVTVYGQISDRRQQLDPSLVKK